jgi:large subunit ribosomal protein L22
MSGFLTACGVPSTAECWVSKGQYIKRIDIKGRARHGIKEHPQARLHVVLKEGLTKAELVEKKKQKVLRKVRSAGVVREERKIINAPTHGWRW